MALILTPEIELQIRCDAERAYPGECCGVLIGDIVGDANYAHEAIVLTNTHEDGPARRFRISSEDFLHVDRLARKLGKTIVGFYHSHPDVAPVPSAYDLENAWEAYSYPIVGVSSGVANQIRSWRLDFASQKFSEENIVRAAACLLATSAQHAVANEVSDPAAIKFE